MEGWDNEWRPVYFDKREYALSGLRERHKEGKSSITRRAHRRRMYGGRGSRGVRFTSPDKKSGEARPRAFKPKDR